jgi:hypothetical protein
MLHDAGAGAVHPAMGVRACAGSHHMISFSCIQRENICFIAFAPPFFLCCNSSSIFKLLKH